MFSFVLFSFPTVNRHYRLSSNGDALLLFYFTKLGEWTHNQSVSQLQSTTSDLWLSPLWWSPQQWWVKYWKSLLKYKIIFPVEKTTQVQKYVVHTLLKVSMLCSLLLSCLSHTRALSFVIYWFSTLGKRKINKPNHTRLCCSTWSPSLSLPVTEPPLVFSLADKSRVSGQTFCTM